MLESTYQARLIRRIRKDLIGCVVIKNDPNYIQGFPDLLILFLDRWAVLEVKVSENAPYQPNQEFYLDLLSRMSFARVIYPRCEEEVLHELYESLTAGR